MCNRVVRALVPSLAIAGLALVLVHTSAAAEDTSPVGRWRTVDDEINEDKSIVTLWEEHGKVHGKIESLLNQEPGEPASPLCEACKDERKDQPLIGMTFMWDLEQDKDEWSGGKILDPNNGKIYRCFIKLEEAGKRLKVRGFIGFALLGRTQYWYRVE